MPDWLTEDAFIPMLIGIFLTVVLLLMAYSARNKIMLIVALIVAAITAGIVTTEKMIVTDRETVVSVVYQLTRHAQQNDTDAIAGYISEQRPEIKTKLYADMSLYKVLSCHVVGFNSFRSDGETATIDFTAWAQGAQRRGGGMRGQISPKVILNFAREANDAWKVTGYEIGDPRSGFKL